MATLSLGNQTIFTQSGSDAPVMDANVNLSNTNIKASFSSLDTTASQGPATDLTNTSLPIFACRAWVNFDGTNLTTVGSEELCGIRGSANIDRVVKVSASEFKIYFETPMPDTNYAAIGGSGRSGARGETETITNMNTDSISFSYGLDATYYSPVYCCIAFFR